MCVQYLVNLAMDNWRQFQECPVLNKACTELADASFPGDTPPQTMQAWDHKDHGYGRNHLKPCGLYNMMGMYGHVNINSYIMTIH